MKILFPKTKVGWRNLVLITLRICPQCKGHLIRDWWWADPGDTIYCMPCGGAMYPNGFWKALASNYLHEKAKQIEATK